MSKTNTYSSTPFQIRHHDRVTIHGKSYRLVMKYPDHYVLECSETECCEPFTFARLGKLNAAGKVHHDVDFWSPEGVRKRIEVSEFSLHDLPPKAKDRLRKRQAFVEAITEMKNDGSLGICT